MRDVWGGGRGSESKPTFSSQAGVGEGGCRGKPLLERQFVQLGGKRKDRHLMRTSIADLPQEL